MVITFVVTSWLVVMALVITMVTLAYRTHAWIDKGIHYEANVQRWWTWLSIVSGAGVCTVLFTIRWQIPSLVWPAVMGCFGIVLGLAMLWQAERRLINE